MRIIRYLSTKGPLFKSFDLLLNTILIFLNESLPTFRSKAMKALSAVSEADPGILGEVC